MNYRDDVVLILFSLSIVEKCAKIYHLNCDGYLDNIRGRHEIDPPKVGLSGHCNVLHKK